MNQDDKEYTDRQLAALRSVARRAVPIPCEPWQTKAHRLIAAMCAHAQQKANRLPNGRMRRKHRPYAVPADAVRLLECLDTNDEIRAKQLFQARCVFNYADHESMSY